MSHDCDEEQECIICCSTEPPLYRVCDCNIWMHEECLQRVVSDVASHSKQCAVCLRPYEFDKTTVKTIRFQFRFFCLAFSVSLCALLPILPNVFLCRQPTSFCNIFQIVLSATSVIAFLVLIYYCQSYRRWSCHWCPFETFATTEFSPKVGTSQ